MDFQIVIPIFDGDIDEYEPIEADTEQLGIIIEEAFEDPEVYPTPESTWPAASMIGTRGECEAQCDGTYAATLAASSFRSFMAIAARFDLE